MAVRKRYSRESSRGRSGISLSFERLEPRQLLSVSHDVFLSPIDLDPSSSGLLSTATAAESGSGALSSGAGASALRQMEALNRGVVAVRTGSSQAYVGWRLLGTDPTDIAFNLYRSAGGGAAVKLNASPLTQTTDFVDSAATGLNFSLPNDYFVRPVIGGVEQDPSETYTLAASAPVQQYLNVLLQRPAGGVVSLPPGTLTPPSGDLNYTYSANDASVGDLDGDGQYEIVLKWDPSNSKDNSQEGLTGSVIIDAYTLEGELLWRIDLGRNIRAGAHYTQFLVYDFDGDGRAEVVLKTADGTVDGQGNTIGNPTADYRDGYTGSGDGRWGRVLSGPEYLTVFDGLTGAALSTVSFSPPRGSVSSWGDNYGNRVDRFLATVAYLDGVHPSIVMGRGYYAKTRLTAFDWRNGQLTQRWEFDSTTPGNGIYEGQGNHNLSVGDVDGDGKDEIIYGAATFDDDGTGLYTTGYGHGDAMHFSDLDPNHPGLEVFEANGDTPNVHAIDIHDAATGETLWSLESTNPDGVGRAVAMDIDPRYDGYELWSTGTDGNLHAVDGEIIGALPGNMQYNFGIWWDADLLRELLDGTTISDWNYVALGRQNLVFAPSGLAANNGSKNNPSLVADILGDWREEVIWRRADNTALQIWTTTIPASNRIYTLMHDPIYRMAIAWQNVGYNQPPHPGFFLGAGMSDPPTPQIYTVQYVPGLAGDYNDNGTVDAADYSVWRDTMTAGGTALANDPTPGIVDESDFLYWREHFGEMSDSGAGSGQAAATSRSVPATALVASPPARESSNSARTSEAAALARRFFGREVQNAGAVHRPSTRARLTPTLEAAAETDRSLLLILDESSRSATKSPNVEQASQFEELATDARSTDLIDVALAEFEPWRGFRWAACKFHI